MGILDWMRRRRPTEEHQRGGILARLVPLWQAGRALPRRSDYLKFADEGYGRNVLMHACIKEIARTAAEPDLVARLPDAEGELEDVAREHPLQILLDNPNSEQSQFEFLEELVTYLEVAGNAYVHKLRSRMGAPAQLWNLRPDRIEIVPDGSGRVARYEFKLEGAAEPTVLRPRDVIHLKFPDPASDHYGLSPIMVLARYGDLDDGAIDYLRAFFLNGGVPLQYLKLKGQVPKSQRERVREQWREQYGGLHGFHSIAVFDEDADLKAAGTTPDRLKLDHVFDETETRICSVYGVPPIIVGTRIGLMRSTMANYEQAVRQMWQETLVPLYTRIGDKLTHGLASEFGGEGLHVVFDLSKIEALQESQDSKRKFAIDGWRESLLTRNEALEVLGRDSKPDGDVYRVSNTVTIGEPDMPALAAGAPRPGQRERELRVVGDDPERHAIPADEFPDEPEWRALHRVADKHDQEMIGAFLDDRNLHARDIDLDELIAALRAGRLAEAERIASTPLPNLRLEGAFRETLATTADEGGDAALRFLARTRPGFDKLNPFAVEWAREHAADLVVRIDERTRRGLRSLIADAIEQGDPPARLGRKIRERVGLLPRDMAAIERFERDLIERGVAEERRTRLVERRVKRALKRRGELIARTETISAVHAGQRDLWEQAAEQGLLDRTKAQRRWITTPDDRLDLEICMPMEGQTVAFDAPFVTPVGGEIMHPPVHPNCRCAAALIAA